MKPVNYNHSFPHREGDVLVDGFEADFQLSTLPPAPKRIPLPNLEWLAIATEDSRKKAGVVEFVRKKELTHEQQIAADTLGYGTNLVSWRAPEVDLRNLKEAA